MGTNLVKEKSFVPIKHTALFSYQVMSLPINLQHLPTALKKNLIIGLKNHVLRKQGIL